MKVFITRPPVRGTGNSKELESLVSWLYMLTDTLNTAFEQIGEENLSRELREALRERREK